MSHCRPLARYGLPAPITSTPGEQHSLEQARQAPAPFLKLELLALQGQDIRPLPWTDRHALLELTATGWRPPLLLTPHTLDHAGALTWMDGSLTATGIEEAAAGVSAPIRVGHGCLPVRSGPGSSEDRGLGGGRWAGAAEDDRLPI